MVIKADLFAGKESGVSDFVTLFLSIGLLILSAHVSAGWFDYDTQEECMGNEKRKLMTSRKEEINHK